MKAQTADSTVSVRAEKTNFLSADAEGKATGSFTVNAKAVTVKSMDVDKDSLADSALAADSTMVLLSEKMYAGAKSSDVKSKKVQVVSEEIGASVPLPTTLSKPSRATARLWCSSMVARPQSAATRRSFMAIPRSTPRRRSRTNSRLRRPLSTMWRPSHPSNRRTSKTVCLPAAVAVVAA